jgi:hypothetical protein
MVNNAVLEIAHRLFWRLKYTATPFLTHKSAFRRVVFGMVSTGRKQSEHSFTAPGCQVIRFADLSLAGIGAVNPKGSGPIPELFPPFASEIRTGEIDATIGFGAS